jgi:hypothetical protein
MTMAIPLKGIDGRARTVDEKSFSDAIYAIADSVTRTVSGIDFSGVEACVDLRGIRFHKCLFDTEFKANSILCDVVFDRCEIRSLKASDSLLVDVDVSGHCIGRLDVSGAFVQGLDLRNSEVGELNVAGVIWDEAAATKKFRTELAETAAERLAKTRGLGRERLDITEGMRPADGARTVRLVLGSDDIASIPVHLKTLRSVAKQAHHERLAKLATFVDPVLGAAQKAAASRLKNPVTTTVVTLGIAAAMVASPSFGTLLDATSNAASLVGGMAAFALFKAGDVFAYNSSASFSRKLRAVVEKMKKASEKPGAHGHGKPEDVRVLATNRYADAEAMLHLLQDVGSSFKNVMKSDGTYFVISSRQHVAAALDILAGKADGDMPAGFRDKNVVVVIEENIATPGQMPRLPCLFAFGRDGSMVAEYANRTSDGATQARGGFVRERGRDGRPSLRKVDGSGRSVPLSDPPDPDAKMTAILRKTITRMASIDPEELDLPTSQALMRAIGGIDHRTHAVQVAQDGSHVVVDRGTGAPDNPHGPTVVRKEGDDWVAVRREYPTAEHVGRIKTRGV